MNARQKKAPDTANTRGAKFNDLKANYKPERANIPQTSGEVLTNFRQFMIENIGYAPNEIKITTGDKPERFDTEKRKDKAGWYFCREHSIMVDDRDTGKPARLWGIVCSFGNHRGGAQFRWNSFSEFFTLSREEKQRIERIQHEQARQRAQEQRVKLENSHLIAVNHWHAATAAYPSHPYLLKKRVGAYGIRQRGNLLLIPLCDLDGVLWGIQTIDPTGNKRFPKGTVKRGHFCLIGDSLTHPRGVYLCEGYATGASLHEAYGLPVLSCCDAGNLLPVAQAYRARFPHVPLTVCADNDRDPSSKGYGVGLAKAREICATLPGVGLIVPEFPEGTPLNFSDFNDLVSLLGSSEK